MVSMEQYEEIVAERPRKFSAEEVGYGRATSNLINCYHCTHFYVRLTDSFAVCEIFRSPETDRVGIFPHFKCQFQTKDGKNFPLYKESDGNEPESPGE